MTTFRIQHTKKFTTISNQAIQDGRLSYRARGIHHLLLSFPDNWVVNEAHLVQSGTEGRDAVRKAIKELVGAGYLRKTQGRDASGTFTQATYDVFEEPQLTVDWKTVDGKTVDWKTVDGKPVNIINTKDTKDLSTKDLSTKQKEKNKKKKETGQPEPPLTPQGGEFPTHEELDQKQGSGNPPEPLSMDCDEAPQPRAKAKSGSGAKRSRRRSPAVKIPKKPGDSFIPENFEVGDDAVQGLARKLTKEFKTIAAVEGALPEDALAKFNKFWTWYRDKQASWSKSPSTLGDRKHALVAFAIVWETDFLGYGLNAWREGARTAIQQFDRSDGVGSTWAVYFLVGKEGKQPCWVPTKEGGPVDEGFMGEAAADEGGAPPMPDWLKIAMRIPVEAKAN